MRRALAVVLISVLLGACVGRPAADATGEEIYLQLCANCHGEGYQGALGPALGPGSPSAGQTDEFLRASITLGRGRMPSFRSSLTDAQVDLLIGHLREVQGG